MSCAKKVYWAGGLFDLKLNIKDAFVKVYETLKR